MMRPRRKSQFLGCIAEVERDQQPVVAGSTLVGQDFAFGLDQRDGANGQRGMHPAKREQMAVEIEHGTGCLQEPFDIAFAPVGVQGKAMARSW